MEKKIQQNSVFAKQVPVKIESSNSVHDGATKQVERHLHDNAKAT